MDNKDSFIPNYLHKERKIFVTGIYGSGKTTYAKEYARLAGFKFIDFDMYFNYAKVTPILRDAFDVHFLNILSTDFVTDAIPWNPETLLFDTFIAYAKENDVRVVCCVCSSRDTWEYRLMVRKGLEMNYERYSYYLVFYRGTLPKYFGLNISYYDTATNEYITKEQMYDRIKWIDVISEKEFA